MSHTPGPWIYIPDINWIEAPDKTLVAQLWGKHEEDFPESEYNGRLIAAAPPATTSAVARPISTSAAVCTQRDPSDEQYFCSLCEERVAQDEAANQRETEPFADSNDPGIPKY